MDDVTQSLTTTDIEPRNALRWYALRDLRRTNSKTPGYKELADKGIEVYTPMHWIIKIVNGKRKRMQVPVLSDLLFAHCERETLDPILAKVPTIQYRYARGAYCVPITVRDDEMQRFIGATSAFEPKYLTPEEASKLSIGSTVRLLGGPMAGMEAKVVNVRGARKKRILLTIPSLIAAIVEVESQMIEKA